jgi:hypothetical protein
MFDNLVAIVPIPQEPGRPNLFFILKLSTETLPSSIAF